MGRTLGCVSALLVTVVTASAQCYQFTSTGATLRVNITSFLVKNGPNLVNGDLESIYSFLGTVPVCTVGGKPALAVLPG